MSDDVNEDIDGGWRQVVPILQKCVSITLPQLWGYTGLSCELTMGSADEETHQQRQPVHIDSFDNKKAALQFSPTPDTVPH